MTGASFREAARRAASLPDDLLLKECEETFFTAGGPGGQHRNKTETGVRLAHGPTKILVTATERRSQARNRATALSRLRERLKAASFLPKPRRPTSPTRGARERRLREKRVLSGRKAARRGQNDD